MKRRAVCPDVISALILVLLGSPVCYSHSKFEQSQRLADYATESGIIEASTAHESDVTPVHKSKQGKAVQEKASQMDGRAYWRADGTVRLATGIGSRRYSGSPEDAAHQFVSENRTLLGSTTVVEFRTTKIHEFGDNTFVRMLQHMDGIPVRGAEVVVMLDRENAVQGISSTFKADLAPVGSWILSRQGAITVARSTKPLGDYQVVAADKAYQPFGTQAIPVWIVRIVSVNPLSDWECTVSATTAEVLSVQSLIVGQARANAFPSNPAKGPLQEVRLENLTSAGKLTGIYAKIYSYFPNLIGLLPINVFSAQVATKDSEGNFLFSPFNFDPRFSEVQLYYAIDRVGAKFRNIGFRAVGAPLAAVASYMDYSPLNGFSGKDNASFCQQCLNSGPGLLFYLGSRGWETAWDSDVVFHEYAHAVVYDYVGGSSGATFRALNEGFADYFSASFLDDPDVGEWFARMAALRTPWLRTVRNSNYWPQYVVGEEHIDGNVWSGALWEVRTLLGPEKTDRIALGCLAQLTGNAEFYDAALTAIIAADTLYGRSVGDQVASVMARRGIYTEPAQIASQATSVLTGALVAGKIPAAQSGIKLVSNQQYRIQVPHQADGLLIEIEATSNVQGFVRYRAPITVENGLIKFDQSTQIGRSLIGRLDYSNIPELQQGVYYVVVANTTTLPVDYILRVTTQGGSANASPKVTLIPAGSTGIGSVPSGPFLASRQFAFDVPSGVNSLTMTLQGSTDVDLYMRYNNPVNLNSQGLPEADLVVDTTSSKEVLTLTGWTIPNLHSGRLYIGVYNYDSSQAAVFSVSALTASVAASQQSVIPATFDRPFDLSVDAASGAAQLSPTQLSIAVPQDTEELTIQADTSSDVGLLVRQGTPVGFREGSAVYDYGFAPRSDAKVLRINGASRPELKPAVYYVGVVNYSPTTATITIRFTLKRKADPARPSIASTQGVVNGASFQPGIAATAWVTVQGTNLAPTSRVWLGSDFIGNKLPTQLDGVSVNINGKPSYVYYISPTQINVLAPDDAAEGPVQVEVTTPQGKSDPVTAQKAKFSPAFFMFDPEGRKYLAAVHADGAYLGKPGLFQGLTTRAAKPGDIILLFGTGFGSTNPFLPAAEIPSQAAALVNPVTIWIGGAQAKVAWAGVISPGLNQFNVTVPDLPNGDQLVVAEIGGVRSAANTFITVGR